MPWDSTQVDEYGPSFAAWTDADWAETVQAVHDTFPMSNYHIVVSAL